MTAQQLLLAFIATATILATAAGIGTARRLRRYRYRPISWTCLECGHTETTKARTRREAWSWIGATMHAHAHHAGHTGSFDGAGMTYTVTTPPEFRRRQE